jgi:hypothetical protein
MQLLRKSKKLNKKKISKRLKSVKKSTNNLQKERPLFLISNLPKEIVQFFRRSFTFTLKSLLKKLTLSL